MRPLLLSVGWVLGAVGLYLPLLLLDVEWNLVNWRPRWDRTTLGLLLWAGAGMLSLALLSRIASDRFSRVFGLILCFFLLGVGVYACPAEPLGTGLFGRAAASPDWYRGLRLLVLGAPFLMWWTLPKKLSS